MSERKFQESRNDRERREYEESIRAEPDWTNIEASRAWLEERYPLLDDASTGSPLFRYMKACVKDPNHMRGRAPMYLGSMLSFNEMMRYSGETNLTVGYDPENEKLYPGYGDAEQDRILEPDWSDKNASRDWLEQRYSLGPAAIGSPLFRYMVACSENRHPMSSPTTHLGLMLTHSEWERFCIAYPNPGRRRDRDRPDHVVLYPEYNNRMWPNPGPGRQSKESARFFTPGWPHIKSLPPPAAKPAMFAESYPPHLRRQSPSSSPSNKRKGDDGDDASPEHPANKRRRNSSGLSGGVMTSANPLNPYEENDIPRQRNDIGSMPPPPRPQQKPAGTMGPGQQRNNKEESRPGRQGTVNMTGTSSRPTHRTIAAEKIPTVLDLNRQSFETQTAGPARQNDQSLETPKTGGPFHTSTVASKPPAHDHNGPIPTNAKRQHDQLAFPGGESETGPGHQPYVQHTIGFAFQNDNSAAHEQANKDPPPIRPGPQHQNQAHVEVNPDAMDIDSDDSGHQTSAFRANMPLVDPPRKRRIEAVDGEQLASSPPKKRRESPDTGRGESLISSPLVETPLADSSRKSSIENVEDASPASSPPKGRQIPSNLGGDESPISSLATETRLADPSRKRSIEDVEDAPPTTSSSKRQRTPPISGGNELPSLGPADPLERSAPTTSPRLGKETTEIGIRGERLDLAPLRPGSPAYEDPTTINFRPNNIEGPALPSGSQSETTDDGRNLEVPNTDDQPTADHRDRDAALNGRGKTQEPSDDGLVYTDPEPQGKRHIHIEVGPDDVIIESEHPRDQAMPKNGDRTEQTAISVVIPSRTPQRQPAANENKRNAGGKPGAKGRKAPQSEPQREQGKRKPPTKGRKNRQTEPKRDEHAYVGRLRSGVGERTHRKPSKYFKPR